MGRQISQAAAWAREAADSGDPRILGKFRAKLIECLDVEQPCPQSIFEDPRLLRSSKLIQYSDYGNLLGDLAIAEFAFTNSQKQSLADIVEQTYFTIREPVGRMQACQFLLSVQPRDIAAVQLLRLLRKAEEANAPRAELVWELAALAKDENLSFQTRESIERRLPKKI